MTDDDVLKEQLTLQKINPDMQYNKDPYFQENVK